MDVGNKFASKFMSCYFIFAISVSRFCTILIDARSLHSRAEQLSKITNYEIITPQRLDGRYRRDVTTEQEDGHLKMPSFVLPIEGEEYILDLYLNGMLFADGFIERTYTEDLIPIDKLPHRTHHCYYHGEVRGNKSSQVALSTCDGLSGLISIDGDTFYLEPLHGSSSEHLIYRPEHVIRDKPLHTFEEDYPKDFIEKGKRRMEEIEERYHERVRRDTREEVKYIELIIVADSELLENMGSESKVNQECKEIANIMDLIYKKLNTRVALASVVIWETDPYVVSSNPSTALGQFQKWRENELVPSMSHDNAQFITGLNFDGSTVGMAPLSTMCSRDQSCGVSQDHGNHANDVASTISHEMGHNLGLNHDSGKECDCQSPPNVGCVMAASSGSNPPLNWSSCSEQEFGDSLNRGLGACLFNYPQVIFEGPLCQNGFLEEGEECDCGPADVCDNPCCVAETCRLHENATCAIGACCENCQLKERGNLCRPMMNECDLPEYCSGTDEECPGNVYRQNGVSCHHVSDTASCFNGMCMSYDDQCSYIWGEGATVAHPKCWRYNQQGNAFGNCGYDENGVLVRCTKANRMCGKLLCEGGAGFPILGALASASQGFIWDENGAKRLCKAASLDQGEDIPDPGYVADGSPCAPNMFCYEHECINHTRAGIVSCPENCNGNGICNSENHCHCNDNWGPPTCAGPGYGGSEDSGPTMPDVPVITTEKLPTTTTTASTTRHTHTSPPIHDGRTDHSVTSLLSTTSNPPTTPFTSSETPSMSFSTVVMIALVVLAVLALILLVSLLLWKRNSFRGRFKLKTISKRPRTVTCKYAPVKKNSPARTIYRPKQPPPARPISSTSVSKVVIEHPSHISEPPPSYESFHRNFGDQLSPVRVAPAPPSNPQQMQMWGFEETAEQFFPTMKYQKQDDAVMYDEPPNVAFVDPSIPRFNPPPSPPPKPEKSLGKFERPRPVSLRSNSVEGPPVSPSTPDKSVVGVQFRLPSTGEDAEPISPVHSAPKPPSFKSEENDVKPPGREILKPVNQTPLKPPGQAFTKPTSHTPVKPPVQPPPKPPGQMPPKPPSQTPLKPPGQTPLKPPGQTPPKPPGQIPLKPPSQIPPKPPLKTSLKPAEEINAQPAVQPSSKPAPPPKKPAIASKPVVSNKPSVPSKPGIPSKPAPIAAPRSALKPVIKQNNYNNSASSSSTSLETDSTNQNIDKPTRSLHGGTKPSLHPPELPKKPSEVQGASKPPPPPPKPVVV